MGTLDQYLTGAWHGSILCCPHWWSAELLACCCGCISRQVPNLASGQFIVTMQQCDLAYLSLQMPYMALSFKAYSPKCHGVHATWPYSHVQRACIGSCAASLSDCLTSLAPASWGQHVEGGHALCLAKDAVTVASCYEMSPC
jgi:hypothetical protein